MGALRLPGVVTRCVCAFARWLGGWDVWALPDPLRSYILAVPLTSLAAVAISGDDTRWQARNAVIFVALLACGAIAVEATRTVKEVHGALSRDLQTVWYLTIAITLPPVYAFAAPMLLTVYKLWRMPRMIVHRRVFSNSTISLAYGCASIIFRSFPGRLASETPGTGRHVLVWTLAVAACGLVAWLINCTLVLVAIKLSDSGARIREFMGTRESITSDLVELSLAVSLSLVVAINPVLMVLALPSIILYRRYLMHAQLMAHARMDAKTGLLNTATWQREATAEFARALRTRAPLALAMVDIDHFKDVDETAGHLVRDQLLRDIAGMLKDQLPEHDLIGRFGSEEFAILLTQTDRNEAKRISERLRDHIAGEPIAIESGNQAGFVFRLTVSIGVAALNESRRALAELIGAADSALEQARSTGWNKVCVISDGLAEAEESQGDLGGW
jgi:diguanylate cyclase (GGDEF)-like protein